MLALATHSIDETRVPERPVVLDVGCRDFDFSNAVLERWPQARIIALDPDPEMSAPDNPAINYCQQALVGREIGTAGYASYSTGHGNFLTEKPAYHDAKMLRVPCTLMRRLMPVYNITHWDIVKLDCEGSEFEILENWPGPIATQISVEFHDYTDLNHWNDAYYDGLFQKLPWYTVIKHGLTPVGPGPSWGHWDSVLVLNT